MLTALTVARPAAAADEPAAAAPHDRTPPATAVEGVGLNPLVIGGDATANPGYVVALLEADQPRADFGQFCGGSLIRADVVLTAAHCADSVTPEEIDVVVGTTLLTTVTAEQRTAVSEIAVHPAWTGPGGGDPDEPDIALLRLAEPATGFPTVVVESAPAEPVIGRSLLVTGWGFADPARSVLLDPLQSATVLALTDTTTSAANATATCFALDPDDDFCYGGATTGACSGDSGGPLLGETEPGSGVYEITGLVSYGPASQCLSPVQLDGAQRVAPYGSWLAWTLGLWSSTPPDPDGPCRFGPTPFTDVRATSFAALPVECLYALGISGGTSATTYAPDESVTREQMAAFIARTIRALGTTCPTDPTPFTDVPATSFAAGDIACLYGLGVTGGTSATTYAPDDDVSREQMASFVARTIRALGTTCPADPAPFTDVPATSFAATDIECIYGLGISGGTTATTYEPETDVSREQMAAFISRTILAVA